MRYLKYLLAVIGWACLLAWMAAFLHGGRKNVMDYARAWIKEPLRQGQILQAADQRLVVWSGWWSVDREGIRLSTSRSPDVLFRWARPAKACDLSITVSPRLAMGQRSQPAYAKIDDAPLVGPIDVATEGTYVLRDVGSVGTDVNVLTLWLPEAQRMHAVDERQQALGLRSMSLTCSEDAATP